MLPSVQSRGDFAGVLRGMVLRTFPRRREGRMSGIGDWDWFWEGHRGLQFSVSLKLRGSDGPEDVSGCSILV